MNKVLVTVLVLSALCFSLAACNGGSSKSASQETSDLQAESQQGSAESGNSESTTPSSTAPTATTAESRENKAVAKDGADMQTDDKSMPTRIPPENGTKINMYFGDTLIPGVLNDSETAQALIAKLPMEQHVSRYSHDFCGVTQDLPYSEEDVHYGWLNGDIDYAINAPYFTILFEDEEVSEQFGDQVNIGVITCPLANIAALKGDYDVRIELAD